MVTEQEKQIIKEIEIAIAKAFGLAQESFSPVIDKYWNNDGKYDSQEFSKAYHIRYNELEDIVKTARSVMEEEKHDFAQDCGLNGFEY